MGYYGGCGEGGWGLGEGKFIIHHSDLFPVYPFAGSLTILKASDADFQSSQGTTIEYAGERAGCSLASMGWTGKRGDVLPPVWVVVHKV